MAAYAICQQLSQAVANQVSTNRKILSSIIKTVALCGQQNIALRGHRDDATNVERDDLFLTNHGNFRALLNFRIDSGDTVLQEHLDTAPRNATYTSYTIQNQIIDIFGSQIRQNILIRVKKAGWYTVIADEVTDLANQELLSVVLRYIDPDTTSIRENFICFLECSTGITGRCLADKIMGCLEAYDLELKKLRGQAYDGAGNMAGSVNGTAALISAKYPLAMYMHCASHCLNLAVVMSLQIASIRNMMGVIDKVYVFFDAHPKRQGALNRAIEENQPGSQVKKLKDLCQTRWVQRIDALQIFQSLHSSIVACLKEIFSDGTALWTSDALSDARSLQLPISTTDFIAALVVTNNCLKYLQALTTNLQAEAKDIVTAMDEIDTVKSSLESVREKVDNYHCQWFRTVEDICRAIEVQPSLPRQCGRQVHRDNMPADTPSAYFKRSISIPLLDYSISEITSRFSPHHKTSLLGMFLVPSVLVTLSEEDCNTKFCELIELYQQDLPSPECVQSELHSWWLKWRKHLSEHGNATECSAYSYTVTSCSAERSFSGLKRVKGPLRSSIGSERLTGLSLLHLHRDIPVDISAAIDEFARAHPRRMKLSNILADTE